jgi:hypothetical protein
VFVAACHPYPLGKPLGEVSSEIAACRFVRVYGLERVGIGEMPCEEIVRRVREQPKPGHPRTFIHIYTSAAKKLAAYSLVRWLLERHQLVLERGSPLLRELAGLRVEQRPQGARIEAEDPAVHDDISDSLAFAMLPSATKRGRVLCGLSRHTDAKTAVPDADVPALDEPVVETGAGLRIFERPPLQSISGSELTLPTDARVRKADPRAAEHERLRAEVRQHLRHEEEARSA